MATGKPDFNANMTEKLELFKNAISKSNIYFLPGGN